MKIATYWWGAELFPESDEEWHTMVGLFTNVTDLGGYDRGRGDNPVKIDDGTGPDSEVRRNIHDGRPIGINDLRPDAVRDGRTTERRCISVDR